MMDNNQKILIELLSLSLRGRKASIDLFNQVNWEYIIGLAQNHSVLPLIYTSISLDFPVEKITKDLKKSVYCLILQQIQNLNILEKVIERFNNEGIPLIVMKGLVLRNLYPSPETRTMSDFDILVKQQDYESSINLLSSIGFTPIGFSRDIHIEMSYYNLVIELHRKLFDEDRISFNNNYLNTFWENAITTAICRKSVLTFSDNDTILYLFLHIFRHFEEGGIGLRQLCDVVVFVEAKQDKIDWEGFYYKTEEFHISKFMLLILTLCNQLFGMNIPDYFNDKNNISNGLIELIIQDILYGGTYGKSTSIRHVGNRIMNKIGTDEYFGYKKLYSFSRFMFPMPNKLGEKYSYAKKSPILLPAAWIHRLVYNIINREQRNMLKVLLSKGTSQNSLEIMSSRKRLLNMLKDEE